jgi:ABC-type nitrate/sulfonate/bicarbonate transport system substrate-binding protein
MKKWSVVGALMVIAVCAALVAGTASASPRAAKLTKVTIQLKWVPQAQFAG